MKVFDPIELEILWKRLISIVDEAGTTFMRTCFSTLVRDANDFAVVLTDRHGRLLVQSSMSIPSFTGTLPATVKHFIKKFPAQTLREGDMLITNDPWMGTGHIHDVSSAMPLFHKGELVAFAAVASHLPDIGGRLRSTASREIYEEGLQIPLIKLMSSGKVDDTLIELIRQNVRVSDQGLGDIWAQVSACRMVGERLQPLLEIFKLDELGTAIRSRSEAAMRKAISLLPDGIYKGHVNHDGFGDVPIDIQCALRVAGDTIDIDYAGSSPQMQRAVNVVPIYTFAYSAYPLKALLCPDVPNNEGSLLPISTRAPIGSIFNPTYPAASGGRAQVGHLLASVLFTALADVMPNQVWAQGASSTTMTVSGKRNGIPFNLTNMINGGQGATSTRDGFSGLSFPGNVGNTPVEVIEALAPIRILRRELRRGSGGMGRHRGGDGLTFEFEVTPDGENVAASFMTTRLTYPPTGLFGGASGSCGRLAINGIDANPTEPHPLKAGDRVLIETAGGGGYGRAQP